MAKREKKKGINKRQKPTLNTKKNRFNQLNDVERAKDYLIQSLDVETIIDAFNKEGILIDLNNIKQSYELDYCFDRLINGIYNEYEDALNELDQKGILLDSDMVLDVIDHYIKTHYNLLELPDADMIDDKIDYIKEYKGDIYPLFITFIKSLIKIKEYLDYNHIYEFKDATYYDIEFFVHFQLKSLKNKVTLEQAEELYELHELLLKTYEFDFKEIVRAYTIEMIGYYDYNRAKELYAKELKGDDMDGYIYISMLSNLEALQDYESMKEVYNKVLSYGEELEVVKDVIDRFGYIMDK